MDAKTNRTPIMTVKLAHPVHAFGEDLREVVFYKPKGRLFRSIENSDRPGEQALEIVSHLTDLPMMTLDTLDFEDALVLARVGASIVEKKSAAGEARLRELGIFDDDDPSSAQTQEEVQA